ncbi:hypothetical protein [Celeribacter litoreus]|uniref:hypothetical protein n=1 Tax=Celeribacter litoreus TaxID=2876714 RepID=UPI001CC997F0|nr:hypothetical protein [Celeribacter litoreus]MCA0044470.1 hypothetical protein [Celeribacter litoreus]
MRLSARLIVNGIWISGFLITAIVGVVAREVLISQGRGVVTIERGIELLIPFAIWSNIPFFPLALIVRWRLKKTLATRPKDYLRIVYIALGAWAGAAIVHGLSLYGSMTYSGPGGFAEVVSMMIVLSIITVPAMILYYGGGAVVGALVGAVAHRISFGPPDWEN